MTLDIWTAKHTRKGSELSPEDQSYVLGAYVHRFTRDHTPHWVGLRDKAAGRYPVQFASDQDWLEHTTFATTSDGHLDRRYRQCHSSPTWPDGNAFW